MPPNGWCAVSSRFEPFNQVLQISLQIGGILCSYVLAYLIRLPAPILASLFAPLRQKPPQEPGPFIASRLRLVGLVVLRISQVSGESILSLCSALERRPVWLASP